MRYYSIGDLARMTGMTVKAVRFYSDSGLIPVAGRTSGGFRCYDADGLSRLKLLGTLRELGFDLPTARRVLGREVSVAEVARTHAEAIDAQLRVLRLRRSVLRAVARSGEVEMVHELAKLSEEERQRVLDDFFEEVFGGLDLEPGFESMMRSVRIELPDDPSPEQVEAWIELANLVRDADFRASIRRMSERHQEMRAEGVDMTGGERNAEAFTIAVARAREAIDAGVEAGSAESREIVREISARLAEELGTLDAEDQWAWLREFGDPRAEHYWVLIARINGWPPVPSTADERRWLLASIG
ncbi:MULTISPECIES: MerR family transcriptional regulator [Actinosynnema]|uniref:MerR family transcriptional regulator n=1 Tax=Actinosynnema TaxID=40566 RepID=UPI0020A3174A|nr:MerR family transcriptional regulator [Actinosynnema pretiosum]MCP2093626.1 DNA-binding transcriptional regulator, MerR family [Actinosynnema pretiosum]